MARIFKTSTLKAVRTMKYSQAVVVSTDVVQMMKQRNVFLLFDVHGAFILKGKGNYYTLFSMKEDLQ